MSLSFGINPWLLIPAAIIAGALTFWLYFKTTPDVSLYKRVFLGALRFTALFIIIVLLFEPILRLFDEEEKRPIVAVLLDNSESLLLTSSEDSSAIVVRSRIREMMEQLSSGLGQSDLRFYTFDQALSEEETAAFNADSLRFDGSRTNIASALEDLRERLRDENLGAALLISDGQYNTGRNPLYTADRYPVPIYTAVLGDTARHRDVQIRRVTTNDLAYVDTELPVQVGVRTQDMGGETVSVAITRDGETISSTQATLPNGSTEITIDLSVTPEEEGLHRYTVQVSRLPDEATHRNNFETFTVRVLSSRRRILLVASAPGPDVSSLQQLIRTDQTFDLSSFVQRDAGSFYEGAFPPDLSDFDLIVLAGYPGSAASREIVNRVASAAQAGTPLFFHLTRTADVSMLDGALADALPAAPERIRSGFAEALFIPTAGGLSHPILNISGASPEAWRRLPPLSYNQTRWQPTPDAQVLARSTVRGVELDDPMLVILRRSGLRTAAMLGSGTWRWHNVPEDLANVAHLWPSLFSNTVQWLTAREDDRPVRVVPVRDLFGGDESVQLSAQVYDESLNPVNDASLEVSVTAPDGTVSPYVMDPIGNGRYTLDAGTFPEGSYRYEAVAQVNGEEIGSDQGSFAVGALTLEFKETRANAPLMRQIAQRSGGGFLDGDEMEEFATGISSSGALASMVVRHESEIELRRRYIFLAIVIFLLAAEWFTRKRSGMV